jgi:hypothetical protein
MSGAAFPQLANLCHHAEVAKGSLLAPCQTTTMLPNTSALYCRADLAKGAPASALLASLAATSAVNYSDTTASHAGLLVRDLNCQRCRSERRY